ncbi:MAG: flagellar basal body L-ring protein FlgH [Candidatus Marinimicrobia bacterium]|nr:flagellar basal body L-ring protein FlgH [Candidatus Neomarinimicrobiota bacterium]
MLADNRFKILAKTLLLTMLLSSSSALGQIAPPSLYADQKARGIGDMVTILIMENAKASRSSENVKDEDNGVTASGTITGNLLQFLPVFGLKSDLHSVSTMREGTSQKDLLTGRISAVITDITEDGLFEVSGSKVININGERNLMTIKGLLRPRDIRSDNTVFSYNVANSRIYYSKAGLAGRLVKRGSIQRLANIVMGGAGLMIIGYVGGLSALAIIRSFAL